MSNKFTAFVVALMVGSSSLAAADGGFGFRPGTIRDHRQPSTTTSEPMLYPSNTAIGTGASRYEGPSPTHKGTGQTVAITDPTRIDSSVLFVTVDPRLRVMTEIALQNTTGRSFVNGVKIQFASGAWQVVRPNVELSSGMPTVRIALAFDEPVVRVNVHGSTATGSAFRVLGR